MTGVCFEQSVLPILRFPPALSAMYHGADGMGSTEPSLALCVGSVGGRSRRGTAPNACSASVSGSSGNSARSVTSPCAHFITLSRRVAFERCGECMSSPEAWASHDATHQFFPIRGADDLARFLEVKTRLQQASAPRPPRLTHVGVRCDGCAKADIEGVRHRCIICDGAISSLSDAPEVLLI